MWPGLRDEVRQIPVLDHLVALTDHVGVIQHARYDIPDRSTGYCTDDVARAFMVAVRAAEHERLRDEALRLGGVYLAFLLNAQLPDGAFHNFLSYDCSWLDERGTQDSIGRAIWALGMGERMAPRGNWRLLCGEMLDRALPVVATLEHSRSLAYAGIGLSHAYATRNASDERIAAELNAIVERFTAYHREHAAPDWDWFEPIMTYDNARLCEVLLRAGKALDNGAAIALGLRTLAFYESIVFERGIFVPIGNRGWYRRGGERARFGQQPLEAASMVDVELLARSLAHEEDVASVRRFHQAETALAWFMGRNARNVDMAIGGGCRDGLEECDVNRNMGAESTLAYLGSAFTFLASTMGVAGSSSTVKAGQLRH